MSPMSANQHENKCRTRHRPTLSWISDDVRPISLKVRSNVGWMSAKYRQMSPMSANQYEKKINMGWLDSSRYTIKVFCKWLQSVTIVLYSPIAWATQGTNIWVSGSPGNWIFECVCVCVSLRDCIFEFDVTHSQSPLQIRMFLHQVAGKWPERFQNHHNQTFIT